MLDCKVTVASLPSILIDPQVNLELVEQTCKQAAKEGARLVLFPELMLTGHGGHTLMKDNAEPVPEGPLSDAVLKMSAQYELAISVGIAELCEHMVYNSQMVVDQGVFLGVQRKINMSMDEYLHFACGEMLQVFEIDELRFGVVLCYDNQFPEHALALSLADVDLIHSPHAARTGDWPEEMDASFKQKTIKSVQDGWEKTHCARAADHNCYVLLNNAVGPATEGLDDVVANHGGTVMGIAPDGEVFLRTAVEDFKAEVVTVELKADARSINHGPTRNRRLLTVQNILKEFIENV